MGTFALTSMLVLGSLAQAPAVQAQPQAQPRPVAATPAAAQPNAARRNCGGQAPRNQAGRAAGRAAAGAVLGGLLGGGRVPAPVVSVALPVQTFLVDAFIDMLDCGEQLKAIGATLQVTEQGERQGVGATVAWRSDTRPNVEGSSTVTAVEPATAQAGGRRCMTVTDIVIIDGQETAMPKRMCRVPPATRYARV